MRHPPLTSEADGFPALVAVAHGSTDPRGAAAVTGLLALVRDRAGLPGLHVRAAYLGHALPPVPDVLTALSGPEQGHMTDAVHPGPSGPPGRRGPARGRRPVVVLPLLLNGAYHSDTDLPAVLRDAARRLPGLRISYGDPLGPHPGLLGALDRRLAEADPATATAAGRSAAGTARDTAVVLAAAGSSRPAANAAVARMAAAWRSARGWGAVVPAFASAASPMPAQAVTRLLRAGARRVLVASYLLAPGVFADQVRETSLAAGAHAVSAPLAAAPEVADVVIERYIQALAAPPLRAAAPPLRAAPATLPAPATRPESVS